MESRISDPKKILNVNKKFIFLLSAIVILSSACRPVNQVKEIESKQTVITDVTTDVTTDVKKDTVRCYYYKDNLGGYSESESGFVLYQDGNKNYYLQSLDERLKRKNEIIFDSIGIRSASFGFGGKVSEKIEILDDSNGQVKEIKKYKSQYDEPLKLESIERYQYNKGLLMSLEYVDIKRIKTFTDSVKILMTHEYDEKDRINKTMINRFGNQGKYRNIDTVNYFYKGNSILPFSVQKSVFEGIEFFITKLSENEIEFKKINKQMYNGNLAVIKTTEVYTFDNAKRVKEYKKMSDINVPPDLKEIKHEKYIYTYSDKENLKRAPKLLYNYGFQNLVPQPNPMSYFFSHIELSGYPDVQIRTDVGFFTVPKVVEVLDSWDGINWKPEYKFVTN